MPKQSTFQESPCCAAAAETRLRPEAKQLAKLDPVPRHTSCHVCSACAADAHVLTCNYVLSYPRNTNYYNIPRFRRLVAYGTAESASL